MKVFSFRLITGVFVLSAGNSLFSQTDLSDLYVEGNYSGVIEAASRFIETGDTSVNTYYLKAMAEVQMGRTAETIQTLQCARKLHPEESRIQKMLAGQYFKAGDYVGARNMYLCLAGKDSSDISSWLKLAEIASFRQQYNEAIKALNHVMVIDSLNLESLMMMGEILNRDYNSKALVYYEKACRLYPYNQKAAYTLGNLYIQASKPSEAVKVCESILYVDSTSTKFRKLMGYAYYKMGEPGLAIAQFQSAVDSGDSTTFTFKFLGISQYLTVDVHGAIESLKIAVKKDSMDAEIHYFLGASLAQTREKPEALFHLDRSLELMQPDPSVISRIYSEQGNIKRLEEEYEQAYGLYNRAWESDPTDPMALYFMASILDNSLHRSREALVDYQRFIVQLDNMPESEISNNQIPTIRVIVEDRILSLTEELFFLDEN